MAKQDFTYSKIASNIEHLLPFLQINAKNKILPNQVRFFIYYLLFVPLIH